MLNNIIDSKIINSIVPITRFNKGEASKIFDEVKNVGLKVVVKNNSPACILIAPEKYLELAEQLEDYILYFEAENRMKNTCKDDFLSESELLNKLGIGEEELEI